MSVLTAIIDKRSNFRSFYLICAFNRELNEHESNNFVRLIAIETSARQTNGGHVEQ